MPGKHAPGSPRSFYVSLAKAIGGALLALGLVVGLAVVAVKSRSDEAPRARSTPTPKQQTQPPATAPPIVGQPTEGPSLRPKSKVSIRVLNGTTKPGLAGRVAARLDREGYKLVQPPANAAPQERTTVYYRARAEADAKAFLDVHPEFGRAREERGGITRDPDALLVIVVGADYERNS